MGDSNGGAPKPAPGSPSPTARASAESMREQQAIAAAILIGEQVRREDRKHLYWLLKRLGLLVAALSFFGLLILFAYSRMRQDFSPTLWMLLIGAIGGGGVVAAYWAYTEDRRG